MGKSTAFFFHCSRLFSFCINRFLQRSHTIFNKRNTLHFSIAIFFHNIDTIFLRNDKAILFTIKIARLIDTNLYSSRMS